MARNDKQPEAQPPFGTEKEEKKRIREEKKKLKAEMKALKKEKKEREAMEGDDEESGSVLSVIMVTAFIVLIWLAILCLLIKCDVGGFGSGVLRPVLKNVPVVNLILPKPKSGDPSISGNEYYGYSTLEDAVERIKELELELQDAQTAQNEKTGNVEELEAEIKRLKTFEDNQVEFQKVKNEFYEEVVYADNGPGADEYQRYYETMDPTTAEYLYKQVVQQEQESTQVQDYAKAYAAMKPKEAAAIFEAMTDNLDLAARILETMGADDRGAILGVMNAETAARLTKIMEPAS